ncbi:FHA domain-containing protein [Rhizobium sp. FKY42]|uniref:FHA domain-containing protein n=1 Tax=Rhizobium sp. FKY42 TaxID=2562310 RepID=UPI0010BFECF1|nr:FHA domain-containing protein [Rhizobium sp. FKY42]
MRLELVPENQGVHADAFDYERWVLVDGRRTIGRSSDCEWRLPQEETSVSLVHCIIERRGDRFILEGCGSSRPAVNGALLTDGVATIISDQSVIDLGKFSFRAVISQERSAHRDEADEELPPSAQPLTISAILSDIVPAGGIAGGPLGPREVTDPLAFIQKPKPGTPSSRNVEIGWSGAPDPQSLTHVLPENWWQEGDAENDLGHSLEHSIATRVSVGIARSARPLEPSEPRTTSIGELAGLVPGHVSDANQAARLESLVRQMEQSLRQASSVMQLRDMPVLASHNVSTAREDPLVQRLEAVLAQQARLNAALEHMFSESARLFDPLMVEVRAGSQHSRFMRWMKEAAYWRLYKNQFESGTGRLSAADLLRGSYQALEENSVSEPSISKASHFQEARTPK